MTTATVKCGRIALCLVPALWALPAQAAPAKPMAHKPAAHKPAMKKPVSKHAMAPKPAAAPVVRMQTNEGVILIKLFPKDAPISSANFEKLVKKGFYNGVTFHRVTDLGGGPGQGHIVQGGDPQGTGNGGPGYTIKGEFAANGVANPLKHKIGAVAMARANDPNSAGSQFYIVVTPAPFLDGNYAVFGQVIKGLDVAAKIKQGDKMTKVTMAQ